MTELIFATNNQYKVDEIQASIGQNVRIITLKEADIQIDMPEPHETLEENAREKSTTIFRVTGRDCFSEDTGLEVDALNGAPGVRSARYAGESADSDQNIKKLLSDLGSGKNRKARFRTVISLLFNGNEYFFDGICDGTIAYVCKGYRGFGYDSVFIPENSDKTFGEMTIDEKSQFSHRRKAGDKLVLFLQQSTGPL